MSSPKYIQNNFQKGMVRSNQPYFSDNSSYYEAHNMVDITDEHLLGTGLAIEESNKECHLFTGVIVGEMTIPQRDAKIFFVRNGDASEVWLLDIDSCTPTFVMSDVEFCCEFNFEECNRIQGEYNFHDVCNELNIYFSSNCEYWTLNIDALLDPNRRDCFKCDDFKLIKPGCVPQVELVANESGGDDLVPGAYYVAIQLEDIEGNTSNYSFIEGPVYIGSENNDPLIDQTSDQSIAIRVDNIDPRFDKINVIVIPPVYEVNGAIGYKIRQQNFNTNGIEVLYFSTSQHEEVVDLGKVIAKSNKYLQGKHVYQYNDTLYLYKIKPFKNLDYQRKALQATLGWDKYGIPSGKAHLFSTLDWDTDYIFGIQWKYFDGSYSRTFPYVNTNKSNSESDLCGCEDWIENTAQRTDTHISYDELEEELLFCYEKYGADQEALERCLSGFLGASTRTQTASTGCEDCVEGVDFNEDIESFAEEIDPQVSDITECMDCGAGTAQPKLEATKGAIVRTLDNLADKFLTDDEICSNGCSDSANIQEALANLYDKAVNNAKEKEPKKVGGSIQITEGQSLQGPDSGGSNREKTGDSNKTTSNNKSRSTQLPEKDPCAEEALPEQEESCYTQFEPIKISSGTFGYAEGCNLYPETKDCNGEKMFGEYADTPITLFRTPSLRKEPNFLSFTDGVESKERPHAAPFRNDIAFFLGPRVENIVFPTDEELPKPLCPFEPYRIVMAEPDRRNNRNVASGILVHTFEGTNGSTTFAVPKNGINSKDLIDVNVDDEGCRLGKPWDKPIYMLYSPEGQFLNRNFNADYLEVNYQLYGKGWRYHMYGKGEEPGEDNVNRLDRRGTTQAINLNRKIIGDIERKCITGIQEVNANDVTKNEAGIDNPIMNKFRESGIALQLESLVTDLDGRIRNGGYGQDTSFVGDGLTHSCPITYGGAWHVTLKNKNRCQYGRIDDLKFIDIGMGGKETSISKATGDIYNSPYSFKRHSYISDKVGDELNTGNISNCGNGGDYTGVISTPEFLGSFPKSVCSFPNRQGERMKEYLGFWNTLELPESGDKKHPKNMVNMYPTLDWDEARTALSATDLYYPRFLTTLIHMWSPSRINLHYRKTGSAELREIHYGNLKGVELDSSINGALPEDSWLDDTHCEHKQPSKRQLAIRGRIRTALIIGLPLLGLGAIAGTETEIDVLSTMFATPVGMGLWLLLTESIFTNRRIDNITGAPLCNTDEQGAKEEKCLRGFKDNYCKYNWVYSALNNFNIFYSIPDNYNVCDCSECKEGNYTNDIYYSNTQVSGSSINAYRNFEANRLTTLQSKSGQLNRIFVENNSFYGHTSDGVHVIQYINNGVQGSATNSDVGINDRFGQSLKLYDGITEGLGGLYNHFDAVSTPMGYQFIDRKARSLFSFRTNTGLVQIGGLGTGMYNFFKENLAPCEGECTDFDYSWGYDHRYKRVLFTQSVACECDKTFTISYRPSGDSKIKWISFHDYIPRFYVWDRDDFFSITRNGVYQHNIPRESYTTYYGQYFPARILFSASEQSQYFQYQSTILDTETLVWDEASKEYKRKRKENSFTEGMFYNSYQNSGILDFDLIDKQVNQRLDQQIQDDRSKPRLNLVGKNYRLDNVKDNVVDAEDAIIIKDCKYLLKSDNKANIDYCKPINESNLLFDNYLYNYLVFNKESDKNYRLIVNKVLTYVKLIQENSH